MFNICVFIYLQLNQLQGDNRSSNISLTPFQQSKTPNPWQVLTMRDASLKCIYI